MVLPTLTTREIPQADTLDNITDTVEFVSKGYCSYQMIAKKLGLVERQGRYYRLAAELLGFIHNLQHQNLARLTPLGKQFLDANNEERRTILFSQIFDVPVVQTVIGILCASEGTALQEEICAVLFDVVTDSTRIMMRRRLQTVLSWLSTLGIITKSGSVIKLVYLPRPVTLVEIKDYRLPVLPTIDEPMLFKSVFSMALDNREKVRLHSKNAGTDRLDQTHEKLRINLAKRIRDIELVSTFNSYIDLAIKVDSIPILCEVKTLTFNNIENEIKQGLSTLAQNKALQCLSKAKIVLFVDKDASQFGSLAKNLEKENSFFAWEGSGNNLFTHTSLDELPFLKVV